MEYEFARKIIPTNTGINEIEPSLEQIGNRVTDFSFGGVKDKYLPFGQPLRVKADKITSVSGVYRRNIYDKIGHNSNLMY